ncbi:MAG: hypothetical protein ACREYF_27525 [Gammaproteobacteria bacterium]
MTLTRCLDDVSPDYYTLLASAKQTLDIKMKSPFPGQLRKTIEFKEFWEPEHVIVKKIREGVSCRLICLRPEAYRAFFRHAKSQMAESPNFEEAQKIIAEIETSGGKVRRISGSVDPEISFVIADSSTALMFCGAWSEPNSGGYQSLALQTQGTELIGFLSQAFELCWKSI